MQIEIQLDDESVRKLVYIQQQTQQDTLAVIKSSIDLRYQQLQQQSNDPLAKLKQSHFIGCFQAESDLAVNSESILHSMMQETDDHR